MIIKVNKGNILFVAEIHAKSCQDSHAAFCSEEFVKQHTIEHQKVYLEKEMQNGIQLYMLVKKYQLGLYQSKTA